MKPIIEVNHLSKKYKYGESKPYYTLRESLADFGRHPFGFGKRDESLAKGEFWALKDVSFKVDKGEAIGIIGPNGAGKSTLLKILSQITPPTSGEAILRGRVGSLLEVGTGFHQELTGRENVYLNGAILGMKRAEINKKFDEIVDFSGIEKFLDTPVKHYSSGMYMRLAFSVAAHLDSEILIVDEVLAVGDVEFQKKCLGKMDEVANKEGRTVIFVSHNMAAIRGLCHKAILMEGGREILVDETNRVVSRYLDGIIGENSFSFTPKVDRSIPFQISNLKVTDKSGRTKGGFSMFEDIYLHVGYIVRENLTGSIAAFTLKRDGLPLLVSFDTDLDQKKFTQRQKGAFESQIIIPGNLLKPGVYSIDFSTGFSHGNILNRADNAINFEVRNDADSTHYSFDKDRKGLISLPLKWYTTKVID